MKVYIRPNDVVRLYSQVDLAAALGISKMLLQYRLRMGYYPQPAHVDNGRRYYTEDEVTRIVQLSQN